MVLTPLHTPHFRQVSIWIDTYKFFWNKLNTLKKIILYIHIHRVFCFLGGMCYFIIFIILLWNRSVTVLQPVVSRESSCQQYMRLGWMPLENSPNCEVSWVLLFILLIYGSIKVKLWYWSFEIKHKLHEVSRQSWKVWPGWVPFKPGYLKQLEQFYFPVEVAATQ